MKKIITFISAFGYTFDPDNQIEYYSADGLVKVEGCLTNEAPVKYLLQVDREIEEIICICSNKVREIDKKYNDSPYIYFEKKLHSYIEKNIDHPVRFIPISFGEEESFEKDFLPRILRSSADIKENDSNRTTFIAKDDTVYLDTTGGFRFNSAQMTLLSRVFLYQGTKIAKVVYAKLGEKNSAGKFENSVILDLTESYRVFDLINGLSEFQSFGSVNLINSYFSEKQLPSNDKVKKLLVEMSKLSEYLTLCRSEQIGDQFIAFQNALEEINDADLSDDPMLNILLTLFRAKFAYVLTTPDQILWCIDNNLVQQAFTLYTDRLPRYLFEEAKILTLPGGSDSYFSAITFFNNKEKYNYALNDGFLNKQPRNTRLNDSNLNRRGTFNDNLAITIENLNTISQRNDEIGFSSELSVGEVQHLLRDYIYAQALRNRLNHVGEELNIQAKREKYLVSKGYTIGLPIYHPESRKSSIDNPMTTELLRNIIHRSMAYLKFLEEKVKKEVNP